MHLSPFTLRLSLVAWSCALLLSGFALTGAALTRETALIAVSAGLFILVALGAPLLFAWRIGRLPGGREEASGDFPVLEETRPGRAKKPSRTAVPEKPLPADDEEALRRTQRAQALDRLRDGITHDLNNRLMVISANIDAVARQMKDQPALRRKLLSALVASDQAAKLIARSTAFARQSKSKLQYVDLTERLNSVATLMSRSLLRDTVELRLSLQEDLWPVHADPDDIETAVVTLSAQVRDALEQGGTITLEAQNVHVRKGSLPDLSLEGDFVKLAIRSVGMGDVAHDPEGGSEYAFALRDLDLSSWLRLNQSLHFLRALGGVSEIRSNGTETAIVIYLPRANAATLLPAGPPDDDDGFGDDGTTRTEILIVDDEVEVALALQSMLEEFGYVTSIATDAGQAMRSLSVGRPGLVLTDVAMPGTMNGIMLAREVRHILPDLPILLITGSPVAADEESEFPVLQKPIVSRDLHAAIQRHLVPPDHDKVVPLFPRAAQRTG